MKLAVLSDFHGATELLPSLKAFLSGAAEAVFFCGDAVKGHARGDEWLAARAQGRTPVLNTPEIEAEAHQDLSYYTLLYSTLCELDMPVFAVPGNMDAPEQRYAHYIVPMSVSSPHLHIVHLSHYLFCSYLVAGIGGELVETSPHRGLVLQYSRKEAELAVGFLSGASLKKILLLHSPPASSLGLDEGTQKGSPVVNSLIECFQPLFVFCGHAHRAQGEERIGSALVINPGALKYGNLAIVDTDSQRTSFHELG